MAVTAKLKCDLNDKPVQEGRQYDAKCEKVQPCENIHSINRSSRKRIAANMPIQTRKRAGRLSGRSWRMRKAEKSIMAEAAHHARTPR